MTRYTFLPADGTVTIGVNGASGVDFSGIDPNIHAIQWYDTVGEIEYVYNPITGEKDPNVPISDITPYLPYVRQAEDIIYAYQHPVTYYFTEPTVYDDKIFFPGENTITYDLGWPQPPNTTTVEPPVITNPFQQLYYYSNAWVVSSVDPNLSLTEAKATLISSVKAEVATLIDKQLRIYSTLDILGSPDPSTLTSADYTITIGDYQTFLEGQKATLLATINAATAVSDLYNLYPTLVEDPTNP